MLRQVVTRAASLVLILVAAPVATAAPVRVPQTVVDLRADADGSVRAVTRADLGSGGKGTSLLRLDPLGVLTPGVPLTGDADGLEAITGPAVPAVTPTGSVVAFPRTQLIALKPDELVVRTYGPGGVVIGDETPAPPGSLPTNVEVAPDGAVALEFDVPPPKSQRAKVGYSHWLAYRPAGAAQFAAPVRLALGRKASPFFSSVALGPTGEGALVMTERFGRKTGATSVRRLLPTGRLGPPITLSRARHTGAFGKAVVGATGAITVVIGTLDVSKRIDSRLTVYHLAPGSGRATHRGFAGSPGMKHGAELVDLAAGVGDQVFVLATRSGTDLELFSGGGTSLASQGRIPSDEVGPGFLLPRPDGSVAIVWGTGAGGVGDQVLITTRGLAGAQTPTRLIAGAGKAEASLSAAAALSDGRVAVAYQDLADGDLDRLLVTLP